MTTRRFLAVASTVVAASALLGACSENANYRDVEGVPLTEPTRIEVYGNVDNHPNVVRMCIDGRAFITTTRARFAVIRADYFDTWCGTEVPR